MPLAWRASYLAHMIIKPVDITITQVFNLSWLEWRTLITVGNAPGISANQLVAYWGFEKMAASRGVQYLLSQKLIRRENDAKDSRRFALYLAPKGQELFSTMWPGAKKHYAEICATLQGDEFLVFCKIVDKLIAQAEQVYTDTVNESLESARPARSRRKSARISRK